MGYIAKAYVKATPVRIAQIQVELEGAGHCIVSRQPRSIICTDDGMVYTVDKLTQDDRDNFIDCNAYTPNGTEEEAEVLFLELAQMRDDAGTDARWLICDCTHFDDMYDDTFERGAVVDGQRYKQLNMDLFSNATPLDVAIGFKEGWIVL